MTAGNEMFLDGYYAPYRKPIKSNDIIKGKALHADLQRKYAPKKRKKQRKNEKVSITHGEALLRTAERMEEK